MGYLNSSEPVFIIKMDNREIRHVNEVAVTECNIPNPIDKNIDDVIHIEHEMGPAISPAYFNQRWYSLKQESVYWEDKLHQKLILQDRENVPSRDVIKLLKDMIKILLHRLRSPLTGIQGYTELLEGEGESKSKYIHKIDEGINELFEILDELETLDEISTDPIKIKNFSGDPIAIIEDILSEYSAEEQANITLDISQRQKIQCNPGDLRRILILLIDNAIVHAPIENNHITVSQPSPTAIKIAHNGSPIPKSITQHLFHPFITNKARRLGIGLTMAILYANRYRGSIFLTENNPSREVSFTLFLPPDSD